MLLVVNTASKCGFTPQFEALEALHAKYQGEGFAVLGFPSGDFKAQESRTRRQIQEFCTLTYGVKFPMFEKVHVVGRRGHAAVRELAAAGRRGAELELPQVPDRPRRQLVASFGSKASPTTRRGGGDRAGAEGAAPAADLSFSRDAQTARDCPPAGPRQ